MSTVSLERSICYSNRATVVSKLSTHVTHSFPTATMVAPKEMSAYLSTYPAYADKVNQLARQQGRIPREIVDVALASHLNYQTDKDARQETTPAIIPEVESIRHPRDSSRKGRRRPVIRTSGYSVELTTPYRLQHLPVTVPQRRTEEWYGGKTTGNGRVRPGWEN